MIQFLQRDDLDFDIVNFPFLDGDVLRRLNLYALQEHLRMHFNNRNNFLTAKLLKQGFAKHFQNFIVGTLNRSENIMSD